MKMVYESEGSVEVCAEITTAVEPSFSINVSTTDGTAGVCAYMCLFDEVFCPCSLLSDSADYMLLSSVMEFESCEVKTCVNISVNADYVLEAREQSFNVHLRASESLLAFPSLSDNIDIPSTPVLVTIKDDTPGMI